MALMDTIWRPFSLLSVRLRIGGKAPAIPVVLLLVSSSFPLAARGQEVGLPQGTEAPAATVQDLDGQPTSLLDHIGNGKPTLLEFWAHWCGQCKLLQPEMDAVKARFGDRVDMVAVAVAVAQTPAQVRQYVEENDPGYPFLWDGDGEAVRNYNVPGTGVVLIFDGEGKLAYTGTGGAQDLTGALSALIQGRPTNPRPTPLPH